MNAFVIDTNILIMSDNIEKSRLKLECAQNCNINLEAAQKGIVVIDSKNEIINEYKHAINQQELKDIPYRRMPVSQAFLRWIYHNLHDPEHVEQVDCSSIDYENHAIFAEGSTLANFDISDRKFVIAVLESKCNPEILVATDTDWLHHEDYLREHVQMKFICPELIKEFAEGKKR